MLCGSGSAGNEVIIGIEVGRDEVSVGMKWMLALWSEERRMARDDVVVAIVVLWYGLGRGWCGSRCSERKVLGGWAMLWLLVLLLCGMESVGRCGC